MSFNKCTYKDDIYHGDSGTYGTSNILTPRQEQLSEEFSKKASMWMVDPKNTEYVSNNKNILMDALAHLPIEEVVHQLNQKYCIEMFYTARIEGLEKIIGGGV